MSVDLVSEARNLHPLEVRVLRWAAVAAGDHNNELELRTESLVTELGFNVGQCNQVFSWLTAKGLIAEKGRTQRTFFELTERGREDQQTGTPYELLADLVKERGPLQLTEIAAELGLDNKDIGSAFGLMAKEGTVAMDEEKRVTVKGDLSSHVRTIRSLLDRAAAEGAIEESTLSPGELQRLRLATQVRSNLFGVVYVLDEPSAGLHPADTEALLPALDGLLAAGNSLFVVGPGMDVIDHLRRQRACRAFADTPVPDEALVTMVRAATHAPSAENRQPWIFVVVRRAATRGAIAELADAAEKKKLPDARIIRADFDRQLAVLERRVARARRVVVLLGQHHVDVVIAGQRPQRATVDLGRR